MISQRLRVDSRPTEGEANVAATSPVLHYPSYGCRFTQLIRSWRREFSRVGRSNATLPFLFVQLSPFHGDNHGSIGGFPCPAEGGTAGGYAPSFPYGGLLPAFRLLQLEALALPNVGMACTVDLGDAASPYWPGSVHPRHKQPVGHRLALEARRIAYGETSLISRGPQLQRIEALPSDTRGSYHSKLVQLARVHWKSVGRGGLQISPSSFSAVSFLATLNSSQVVPGTIMPTNLTATSCDVYFNLGFNLSLNYVTRIAYLPFDFPPHVPIFGATGLPSEPFDVQWTASP